MNIKWNELRDEVHKNAKDKGFWDCEVWSLPEKLALIHSEVSEALEADRMDRHCKATAKLKTWMLKTVEEITFADNFILHIKDTFEDELADIVIRCLDLCGECDIDVNSYFTEIGDGDEESSWFPNEHTNAEKICVIHFWISNIFREISIQKFSYPIRNYDIGNGLTDVIDCVQELCCDNNIDLITHIKLKMKYNAMREYKHGKRY